MNLGELDGHLWCSVKELNGKGAGCGTRNDAFNVKGVDLSYYGPSR